MDIENKPQGEQGEDENIDEHLNQFESEEHSISQPVMLDMMKQFAEQRRQERLSNN
ncbi:hypothetical protein [Pedobacter nyackensis]|uniref:hypothetical protein n=1 Tax=Pedobacter nyackensis TaxID=475255 RepID=UPI00292CF3FF|nr:hypothetical protein [Pedobacter nyackensis]